MWKSFRAKTGSAVGGTKPLEEGEVRPGPDQRFSTFQLIRPIANFRGEDLLDMPMRPPPPPEPDVPDVRTAQDHQVLQHIWQQQQVLERMLAAARSGKAADAAEDARVFSSLRAAQQRVAAARAQHDAARSAMQQAAAAPPRPPADDRLRRRRDQHQVQLAALQRQRDQVHQEAVEADFRLRQRLQQQAVEMEAARAILTHETNIANARSTASQQREAGLQQALDALRATKQREQASHAQQLQRIRAAEGQNTFADLTHRIRDQESSNARLRSQLQSAQRDLDATTERRDQLRSAQAQTLDDLQSAIEDQTRAVEEARERKEALTAALASQSLELRTMHTAQQTSIVTISQLRTSVRGAQLVADGAGQSVAELQVQVNDLQEQLREQESALEALREALRTRASTAQTRAALEQRKRALDASLLELVRQTPTARSFLALHERMSLPSRQQALDAVAQHMVATMDAAIRACGTPPNVSTDALRHLQQVYGAVQADIATLSPMALPVPMPEYLATLRSFERSVQLQADMLHWGEIFQQASMETNVVSEVQEIERGFQHNLPPTWEMGAGTQTALASMLAAIRTRKEDLQARLAAARRDATALRSQVQQTLRDYPTLPAAVAILQITDAITANTDGDVLDVESQVRQALALLPQIEKNLDDFEKEREAERQAHILAQRRQQIDDAQRRADEEAAARNVREGIMGAKLEHAPLSDVLAQVALRGKDFQAAFITALLQTSINPTILSSSTLAAPGSDGHVKAVKQVIDSITNPDLDWHMFNMDSLMKILDPSSHALVKTFRIIRGLFTGPPKPSQQSERLVELGLTDEITAESVLKWAVKRAYGATPAATMEQVTDNDIRLWVAQRDGIQRREYAALVDSWVGEGDEYPRVLAELWRRLQQQGLAPLDRDQVKRALQTSMPEGEAVEMIEKMATTPFNLEDLEYFRGAMDTDSTRELANVLKATVDTTHEELASFTKSMNPFTTTYTNIIDGLDHGQLAEELLRRARGEAEKARVMRMLRHVSKQDLDDDEDLLDADDVGDLNTLLAKMKRVVKAVSKDVLRRTLTVLQQPGAASTSTEQKQTEVWGAAVQRGLHNRRTNQKQYRSFVHRLQEKGEVDAEIIRRINLLSEEEGKEFLLELGRALAGTAVSLNRTQVRRDDNGNVVVEYTRIRDLPDTLEDLDARATDLRIKDYSAKDLKEALLQVPDGSFTKGASIFEDAIQKEKDEIVERVRRAKEQAKREQEEAAAELARRSDELSRIRDQYAKARYERAKKGAAERDRAAELVRVAREAAEADAKRKQPRVPAVVDRIHSHDHDHGGGAGNDGDDLEVERYEAEEKRLQETVDKLYEKQKKKRQITARLNILFEESLRFTGDVTSAKDKAETLQRMKEFTKGADMRLAVIGGRHRL